MNLIGKPRSDEVAFSVPWTPYGCRVSLFRQGINLLGCAIAVIGYYFLVMHTEYPITFDIFVTILLAEFTRWCNGRRRDDFYRKQGKPREKEDCEKIDPEMQPVVRDLDCMAAVVGWREDPVLFAKALSSYQSARKCGFLLVGIDGDEIEDHDMVKAFNKACSGQNPMSHVIHTNTNASLQVYPENSRVIHVPEPLGEVAARVRSKVMAMQTQNGEAADETQCNEIALQYCIDLARTILFQQAITIGGTGPNAVRHLCLTQRHMHKKGIMFTTFVFSLVIADILGVEFLWSSDSDTLVFPSTLEHTIDVMASDKSVGGASCGLVLHNAADSAVTKLASTVYWGELYLTRSTPACTATSDCQSGPSTVFRLAALPPILVPWYLQTVLGRRMIVNEDRHLTTNLLLRGWGVVFASDVLASTDTPATLPRWLKQQVRWARAAHIESLLQPRVYAVCNPLLFYGMTRREFGPVVAAAEVLYFLVAGKHLISVSVADAAMRFVVSGAYNWVRNPDRLESTRWWVPLGVLFYHVPLPAVQVWSLLTMGSDGWGSPMRAAGSQESQAQPASREWFDLGFFVIWIGVVAGAVARYAAEQYCLVLGGSLFLVSASMTAASVCCWKVTFQAQ